jgi:plastocyanin
MAGPPADRVLPSKNIYRLRSENRRQQLTGPGFDSPHLHRSEPADLGGFILGSSQASVDARYRRTTSGGVNLKHMTRIAITSLAAVLALAACGDDDATTTTAASATTTTAASATTAPAGTGDTEEVSVEGFAFAPQNITVSVGTTVRWTNADGTTHTATAAEGEFNGSMSSGATFEHTFDTAGVFDYFCSIHGNMTGEITVEG